MKVHGITLEVSLGFILRQPKELSISMEIPSNITLQLHSYLEVLQRVILFILLVNLCRCCEIDNDDLIRKEKEKAKAKEKEKEKGKRKSKNTGLEGDNCFNLSLLADLRYVITNIIEISCNNVQSYHSFSVRDSSTESLLGIKSRINDIRRSLVLSKKSYPKKFLLFFILDRDFV